MKNKLRHAGQTLVEFVLILPIFLLLIMGLFDIGRAVLYYAVLNNAAREGTRYAVVQEYSAYESGNCNTAASTVNLNICQKVRDGFAGIGDLQSSTITITHGEDSNEDAIVTISVTFDFVPITPGLNLIGDFTLAADSRMLMTPKAMP